jgi:IS1 family transposase
VWVGFDSRHKVVIHFVVGRHVQANANRLVKGVCDRSDGHLSLFTSDELEHNDNALLEAYGLRQEVPRTGKRGRLRKPQLIAPRNLLYAQVVKRRQRGRVVEITTRVVFGTQQAVAAKLRHSPVSKHIDTSFVERNNLTMRHQNRRLVRKMIAFSKKRQRLEQQLLPSR